MKAFHNMKRVKQLRRKLREAIRRANIAETSLREERNILKLRLSDLDKTKKHLLSMIYELKKINSEQQALTYPVLKMIQGHEDKLNYFEAEAKKVAY